MPAPTTSPVELDEPELDSVVDLDKPWLVIVWNDPINLMSYVTFVLQKLFGYSRAKAEKMMLDVHHKVGPSCRRVRRKKPNSTSRAFTSTACGRRWNKIREPLAPADAN
jgi:hypothetical protein